MGDMLVRFWGVRGSIPAPGPGTTIYGGNTPCVEVRCGTRCLILDAGSGLRPLGQSLARRGEALNLDLLLTHCHLDHLIGLPFFAPAFHAEAELRLRAGHLSPHEQLARVVSQLMIPPLLPITPDKFKAAISYHDFMAGDRFTLDEIEVSTAALRHPGGATGYRLAYGGRAICYVTDNEHPPDGPDPALVQLARDVDLLIYDSMYTAAEYPHKIGWGHSTWNEGVRLADAAGVARLALFHHAPDRDDAALETLESEAAASRPGTFAAREGMELTFPSVAAAPAAH